MTERTDRRDHVRVWAEGEDRQDNVTERTDRHDHARVWAQGEELCHVVWAASPHLPTHGGGLQLVLLWVCPGHPAISGVCPKEKLSMSLLTPVAFNCQNVFASIFFFFYGSMSLTEESKGDIYSPPPNKKKKK